MDTLRTLNDRLDLSRPPSDAELKTLLTEHNDEPRATLAIAAWSLSALTHGQHERARERLAQARAHLDSLERNGQRRDDIRVRLLTLAARLSRARGDLRDANEYVEQADRAWRRLNGEQAARTGIALLHLKGIVAIERGADKLAERCLREGLALANDFEARRISPFHRTLGGLETRRGRPAQGAHHYRLALDLTEPNGVDEVSALCSNLGMTALMRGRLDEATHWTARARTLRDKPDAPPGPLANTTALGALLEEARGETAWTSWRRALELAQKGGELSLVLEIELRCALYAIRSGRMKQAQNLYQKSCERIANIFRQEPTITALRQEFEGRLLLASGQSRKAASRMLLAREAFSDIGAIYHVARIDTLLCATEWAAGRAETAIERADATCRQANRGGFCLPDEAGFRECLSAAIHKGKPEAIRYARRVGLEIPHGESGIAFHGRSGALTVDGVRHDLGRNRIISRLLRILLDRRPHAVTSETLCQHLWPAEGTTTATYNRLKVHICSLRTLLGPAYPAIVTSPPRPGRHLASYRWNSEIPVRRKRSISTVGLRLGTVTRRLCV